LHHRVVKILGIEHDRQLIAGEALMGEYVERDKSTAHQSLRAYLPSRAGTDRPR
jgi:hypothetical protein